jgi:hypothetical protein
VPRESKYPQFLWDEARASVEAGEAVQAAAKRLGINREALRKRAKSQHWKLLTPEEKRQQRAKEREDQEDQDRGPPLAPFDPTGADERSNLIRFHQREWADVEKIRKLAVEVFTNDKFKPEDASEDWDSDDRLKYAHKLFTMYNTAANALMVAQEGQRRSYGFDYRDQRKAASAEGQDQTRRAELMTEIAALIEIITSKEPEIVEGECHQHADGDDGPAAASDSPGSGDA